MTEIETIFEHQANNGAAGILGIDSSGQLYWNNQPVTTKQKITFQLWVNIAGILAALSTVVMAIISVLTFLNIKICS